MSEPSGFRRIPVMADRATVMHASVRSWAPGGLRSNWPLPAYVLGVCLAFAGAYLGLSRPTVVVALDAGGYRVGGYRLARVASDTYAGSGAVALSHRGGVVQAGASAVIDGEKFVGLCVMPDGGASERCLFTVGSRSITAVDTRVDAGWARRYDDGTTVVIGLQDGRAVPVPFPIGRRG